MFEGDVVAAFCGAALGGAWGWITGFYVGSKRAHFLLHELEERPTDNQAGLNATIVSQEQVTALRTQAQQ